MTMADTLHPPRLLFLAFSLSVTACGGPGLAVGESELLLEQSPPTWFENYGDRLEVVGNASLAIYGGSSGFSVLERNAAPVGLEEALGVEGNILNVAVTPAGELAVSLQTDGHHEWREARGRTLLDAEDTPVLSGIPAWATPRWSPDGGRIAYRDPIDANVLIIAHANGTTATVELDRTIADYDWRAGTPELVLLADNHDGSGALVLADADTGTWENLVPAVDGIPLAPGPAMAILPSGRGAVISIVGVGRPDPEARHTPSGNRDLDLYFVDLGTGDVEYLTGTDGDDHDPRIKGDTLFWTSSSVQTSVVVLPIEGGDVRTVAQHAQGPVWHPDGGSLGVTIGDFRRADWGLNLDGAVVEIDEIGEASSPIEPYIVGYHEDFTPVWSPNEKWVAYHSHRSPIPVASYFSPGSADDIYIRSIGEDGSTGVERRLFDWGHEVGTPTWNPTSSRILFTAQNALNEDGTIVTTSTDIPWVLSLDAESGDVISAEPLPLPRGVSRVMGVAWGPDGRIAIEAQEADSVHAIWTITPGVGSGRVTAYVMETYGGVAWARAADGEDRLVISARQEGEMRLFSVAVAGRGVRPISLPGMNIFQPSVSPDGRWVAGTQIKVTKQAWKATFRP